MNIIEIIEKKRDGLALSEAEIDYWIKGLCEGSIADYQSSALLMAIYLNGMNDEETFYLTKAMTYSGDMLDFSMIDGVKVDKHSSGGVGDKTSIALMPIVAACGAKVAKMSGGALGFMGGTVDKLSSIPGMSVFLTTEEIIEQVKEIGIAMVGQTGNLCPADKKIYALRDVTGTVNSLPLIVSSIMSKKLACGDDVIVLDVKYGDGSAMVNIIDAENLARSMISVGKQYGKNIGACITSMVQPLGKAIGNVLEVKEAIDTLHGNGPEDLNELVFMSGAQLLSKAGLYTYDEAVKVMKEKVENGEAAKLLKTMIEKQGGDGRVVDDTSLLPRSAMISEMRAEQSGYIAGLGSRALGELSMDLGAGRKNAEDKIDYSVGIVLNRKVGDYVEKGDILAYIHHNRPLEKAWIDKYHTVTRYSEVPVKAPKIVEKVI
ncbi:MAG: thymidine phosphorylase [Erysipelotrichaceae bacterium]|nr:thymidine phosphorylase [Erysipelotrichaceae bacterium]